MKKTMTLFCAALATASLAACSGKPASAQAARNPARHVHMAFQTWMTMGRKTGGVKTASDPVTVRKPAGDFWPTRGWRTSTPEDQDMDGVRLQAAIDSARMQELTLHGVLVIRHGYIVLERYFGDYDETSVHSLYSCTKSFISALVGIAVSQKLIPDLAQKVVSFFPDETFAGAGEGSSKRAMTVENLLTMSSGLDWDEEDATYDRMYSSSRDWVKFVMDIPMADTPGLSFNYSSGNSHLLSAIIQKASGENTYDYARTNLFGPLGIKDPAWERDPSGIPIGGWGLTLTPRDMAKLGYLYLHEGTWEGKQLLPASWVHESTEPHIRAGDEWDYGYQWWVDPARAFFAAIGRHGQSIIVVPKLDMVVVFTAHIEDTDPETDLLQKYIIPACAPIRRR